MSARRALGLVVLLAAVAVSLGACGRGGNSSASSTTSADEEIIALARAWYADADPAVCDQMTDAMLGHGWGMHGEEGRNECKKLVGNADPAVDVVVGSPTIDGDHATVEITYGPADDRRVDKLDLLLVSGAWQVDNFALVGAAGATETEGA